MIKRLIIGTFFAVAILVFLLFWWQVSTSPVSPNNNTTKIFVVEKGQGVREISKNLKSLGLIRSPTAFFILVKIKNLETKLQAGDFRLSPSMPALDLAENLTHGTLDQWITIPEGWRSEEILTYLKMSGDWKKDEGKLFPDTYLVPKTASAEDIRTIMLNNFSQKVGTISADKLIVASLVEREARAEQDRPLVASVIYNRLQAGMALDIDATIQYALGFWKKDLTLEDLKIKSPYNTYQNPGLPPGPICNPGLSAIKAAITPEKTDYLYYLSDKAGVMHFAKTLLEHNQNVARYL